MGNTSSRERLNEQMRSHKRMINRSIRDLDRERSQLEIQEKKLIQDTRQLAAKGQMKAVKTAAKDLVRVRKSKQKFYQMRSQLQAISLRIQTAKSSHAMADSLKGVASTMKKVNAQMDIPKLQEMIKLFMQESEKLGLTEEMLEDSIDDAVADAEDDEEEEKIVSQVLEEIGVDLTAQLTSAPFTAIQSKGSQNEVHANSLEKELEDRLDNLNR